MLRAACGRGGTSTKIRSDCGTQVLGGKKGGGAGGEEHLIPTLLITFCNHPIIPCLVSKSKMATPQTQTLTVTGRSTGEKYTRSARYIKTKHSDKKKQQQDETNLRTSAGNVNPSGKKKTSKFEVLYLLANFTLWSWCNNGEKCIKKCDACADR